MAVYTEVSFDDLDTLLAGYDVGRPKSFKGIAEGVENSNFLLQTDRADFILTLYEKRVRESDLPYFLGLMEHLAARGVRCPVPVRRRDGAMWTKVNGKSAALLTYLEGLSLNRPETAHCAVAAAACAKMHDAGKDFALTRANALGPRDWRKLVDATIADADSVQQGLSALLTNTLAPLERNWPSGLPGGVIHADLFPDNVLFTQHQVPGLIDFYFACNDFHAYDIAVMLNAWCFERDGSYNLTNGRAMLTAYRRVRELTAEERAALPMLARGAALRFLLTRLYDWLNPDPSAIVRAKDPREFAKRLRFFSTANKPADLGL
ncbi:MAG TPA: homoserine kinase [Rhizomicrobium sp.]|jgi:homoserine kinase type II